MRGREILYISWNALGEQLESVRGGVIASAVFHITVIALLIFGLPQFTDPPANALIPIEVVILEEAPPKPEPAPEPKPVPKADAPTPEPEPVQEAKVEPEPEPPKAEPEPEAEAVPLPETKPKKKVEPAPPKPKRRPEIKVVMPEERKQKKKEDQLTSILRNVERLRDKPRPQREQIASTDSEATTSLQVSAFEQNEMVRAVQEQLRQCWRLDPGAREAEDMVVEIRVVLNPDGSVRKTEIVDVVRMVQNAYFRSAAENAKRAINVCSPFRLPQGKYQVWRELTLRFNPREMFGT